jgi:glyoxylase-like metal-dependent hydrolase (beta-lactamase superfamily II)
MTMESLGANIFVETVYPGVNVGCIVTDEGAVCVDTPLLPGEAQRWRARIRSLGADFIRFVVYTSGQSDRVLGTQYFICEEGDPCIQQFAHTRQTSRPRGLLFPHLTSPSPPEQYKSVRMGTVVAHTAAWQQVQEHRTDSFKQSMIDTFGDRDPDVVNLEIILPQITFEKSLKLYAGDATIMFFRAAPGVLWVWLAEEAVFFAGETVVVGTHPCLTVASVKEWLGALEWLRREKEFSDAVVVPGRGPLTDTSAVEPLMEYLRVAHQKAFEVYRAGRPKAELNEVAAELLPAYPVADGQRERVQRQIKLGLDGLYDEFKATDAASE